MKTTPMGPFERVDDGEQIRVRCPKCSASERMWNNAAFDQIRAQRFGRTRLLLQYPWVVYGSVGFLIRHRSCLKGWRSDRG